MLAKSLLLAFVATATASGADSCASPSRPKAVVYHGAYTCDSCHTRLGKLLETSRFHFNVVYAGPNEPIPLNAKTLEGATVLVQPGGDPLSAAADEADAYADDVQKWVSNGGHYLGFCLGAYLAGPDIINILPDGIHVDQEIERHKAQFHDAENHVADVDWTFSSGPDAGKTEKKRQVFFQDGAVVLGLNSSDADTHILARYSSNGDVAATVSTYGKGRVGLIGPHAEADSTWYIDPPLPMPNRSTTDIAYDFIEAVMKK